MQDIGEGEYGPGWLGPALPTETKLCKTAAIALALGLVATAPAMAADAWDDWDANRDAGIDNDEFGAGFGGNGVFDGWDADADGVLSEDEFSEGVFSGYDDNDDGVIDEPEFGDYGDDIGDEGFWDV